MRKRDGEGRDRGGEGRETRCRKERRMTEKLARTHLISLYMTAPQYINIKRCYAGTTNPLCVCVCVCVTGV